MRWEVYALGLVALYASLGIGYAAYQCRRLEDSALWLFGRSAYLASRSGRWRYTPPK